MLLNKRLLTVLGEDEGATATEAVGAISYNSETEGSLKNMRVWGKTTVSGTADYPTSQASFLSVGDEAIGTTSKPYSIRLKVHNRQWMTGELLEEIMMDEKLGLYRGRSEDGTLFYYETTTTQLDYATARFVRFPPQTIFTLTVPIIASENDIYYGLVVGNLGMKTYPSGVYECYGREADIVDGISYMSVTNAAANSPHTLIHRVQNRAKRTVSVLIEKVGCEVGLYAKQTPTPYEGVSLDMGIDAPLSSITLSDGRVIRDELMPMAGRITRRLESFTVAGDLPLSVHAKGQTIYFRIPLPFTAAPCRELITDRFKTSLDFEQFSNLEYGAMISEGAESLFLRLGDITTLDAAAEFLDSTPLTVIYPTRDERTEETDGILTCIAPKGEVGVEVCALQDTDFTIYHV